MSAANERRPAATNSGPASDHRGAAVQHTVPPPDDDQPDLAWLLERPVRWSTWLAGYRCGYGHGVAAGHAQGYERGREHGYHDGQVQGRWDHQHDAARGFLARDVLADLEAAAERWDRAAEARARGVLVEPARAVEPAPGDRERALLSVVLERLGDRAHRELVRGWAG